MPLDWFLHLRRAFASSRDGDCDAEMLVIGAALIAIGILHL
jgi:hypothetical protein